MTSRVTSRVTRRAALAGALALPAAPLLGSLPGHAQAAWKPNQGVKIVVPAAPGGTTEQRVSAGSTLTVQGRSVVVLQKTA